MTLITMVINAPNLSFLKCKKYRMKMIDSDIKKKARQGIRFQFSLYHEARQALIISRENTNIF